MFTYYQFFHVRPDHSLVFGPSHSCNTLEEMQRLVALRYPEGLQGRYVIQRITIDPFAAYQSAECRLVDVNGEPVQVPEQPSNDSVHDHYAIDDIV